MTNKLPVVGEKYKSKCSGSLYKLQEISGRLIILRSKKDKKYSNLEDFWFNYEEIPDDKPEIRKENPPVISELSEEVKQAMENLKLSNELLKEKVKSMEAHLKEANDEDAIEISQPFIDTIKIKIQQSQDLVDALEKQFGGKK